MIERYSRPEMSKLWSDEHRVRLLLRVEAACLEAMSRERAIPAAEIKAFKALDARKVIERARAAETRSAHEVVAILAGAVSLLKGKTPNLERYLHFGLTSSDALDTAFALQLVEAADLLVEDWRLVAAALKALARKHEKTPMVGRTHGVHAEPTTFGLKLAGWHAEAQRNIERLLRAREIAGFGKISGAVGTFVHMGTRFEAEACDRLGLRCEPVSTQVVPRDRHADYFHALVLSAAAVERFALEIRHLQRTEVLEVAEPFGEGQKGSSAMPHKRNPVLCENLCGLARLVRSYEHAVVENIALWHERDISHSSVERVVFPDAAIVLDFMLGRLRMVLEGLRVYPERMKANLESSRGMVYSQRILLKLVDAGLPRAQAYELVQRASARSWDEGLALKTALEAEPAVLKRLSRKELEECFDPASYAVHAREILKRGGVS